jgi:FtsP/CotA-like multicopper oxidase with cupredoxin domain
MSCVEFRIGSVVTDNSVNPATHPSFYQLPSVITPRITRNFNFDRDNGQWVINGRFANCNELRFAVTQNSAENWLLSNPRSDWQHPIHVHLEEHQILSRSSNGGHRFSYSHHSRHAGAGSSSWSSHGDCAFGGGGGGISTTRPNVPNVEVSRKDVTRLQANEDVKVFFRFRDFQGDWAMHCHNTIHEDHAMMLLFQVQPGVTDNNQNP